MKAGHKNTPIFVGGESSLLRRWELFYFLGAKNKTAPEEAALFARRGVKHHESVRERAIREG